MHASKTFEHFIQPLPPVATGDHTLDDIIAAVEIGEDEPAMATLAARVDAGSALLARLEQVAASVGDVDASQAAERAVYEAVFAEQSDRSGRLEALAQAVAAHLTPASEAAMLRLFEEHPWSQLRLSVGMALVAASSSRATFERLARAMDLTDPKMVWVRDVGTAAAVRIDPATAFDRLQPRFEAELAKSHSYLARGLFTALGTYATPMDPRWFPFLVRFYDHGEAVMMDAFLRRNPAPAAVEALSAFLGARAAIGKPWLPYAGFTLVEWGPKGKAAGPAVVQAVEAALDAGWADFRLVGPLNALVVMDDPSVLPALRSMEGKATRKSKTVFQEALKKLARNEPASPVNAKIRKAPTAKKAVAKDAWAAEREALAACLADAGFSENRVIELVGLAKSRIVLEPVENGKSGIGENRFGGEPDLPPGTAWPIVRLTKKAAEEQLWQGLAETPHSVDGKHVILPLGFVAQVRLESLAHLDHEGKLPKAGLLSFFARQDMQPGEHGELFRIAASVLFHANVDGFAPCRPPADVQERDRHGACGMKVTREFPLAPPPFAYALGLLQDETSRYDELYARTVDSSPFGTLGYARAAYYRGLPVRGDTLLLQIASGGATSFGWGDDSSIFFLLADVALKKREFAKAVCVMDEC